MYKKKKFEKRYLIIIGIFVIALLLVILSVALKKDRDLNPLERIIKDTGTFTINIVSSPVNFVKDRIRIRHEKNEIYKEYKDLKKKEKEINSLTAENQNQKDEIEKLKKQLELNKILSTKVLLNATVINRNIDYWNDELTIDKGKKPGAQKNMAVINSDGLIGKITKASNHYSTVKLLANENTIDKTSVKVKVKDGYIYGLISKYDSKTNTYTVEGISENKDIEIGADVVTTGMGDYPSGLLIGKVKDLNTDNFDLSKVLIVTPTVNFNNIDYVTVLKGKDSKWFLLP